MQPGMKLCLSFQWLSSDWIVANSAFEGHISVAMSLALSGKSCPGAFHFLGLFIFGCEIFWSFWYFQGGKCSVIKVLDLAWRIKQWGEVSFHGAPGQVANPFQERGLPFYSTVEFSGELRCSSCLTLQEWMWKKGELPSWPAIWGGWPALRRFPTLCPHQLWLFSLT